MNTYGKGSREALSTAHPKLKKIFKAVLSEVDHTVITGHRGETAQEAAVATGKSKAKWPTSKHNSLPSRAVDVAPYMVSVGTTGGIPWEDKWVWKAFADVVLKKAKQLGIGIKWGGNFHSFFDGPHFQLEDDE